MGDLVLKGATSGQITITPTGVAGTNTLTLPAKTGNLITSADSGTVTTAMLASGAITTSTLPNGTILQVKNTNLSSTFTTTSTTWVDVTGLSVSITPLRSTSTILVIVTIQGSGSQGASNLTARLVRGSTVIDAGAAGGASQPLGFAMSYAPDGNTVTTMATNYIDSPATTSSTTYKVQIQCNSASTIYVNRSQTDTNSSTCGRFASNITVMEIAA